MTLVIFADPRTASTYAWAVNPNSETPAGKQRAIERTSNTANVGATKQQGDDGSLILDWSVIVPTSAMQLALWEWYMLCKLQTIYVTDWNGEQFEGQIISLSRQHRVDGDQFTTYEVLFEVYRFVSGMFATAGVTP